MVLSSLSSCFSVLLERADAKEKGNSKRNRNQNRNQRPHGGTYFNRDCLQTPYFSWRVGQDSNLQPSDPKLEDALFFPFAPLGRGCKMPVVIGDFVFLHFLPL